MIFSRGLAALILTLLFSTTIYAEYLYKDDVVNNPRFNETVGVLGSELFEQTGVKLYMVMTRELENNQSIVDYEKELAQELEEPFVLLSFSELDKQLDIYAQPASLYKDFDKNRILSPNGNFMSALVTVLMFARSLDDVKEVFNNYGGVILPVISQKVKDGNVVKKYSVGMYNGYSEIAEEIATSRGIVLKNAAGNGSKNFIDVIRVIFYGTILFAIFQYFRARRRAQLKSKAQTEREVKDLEEKMRED